MKTKFKIFLCIMLLFIVSGCHKTTTQEYPFFTIKLFYLDECSSCNSFKNNGLPKIREAFNNNFEIDYYNLDIEENEVIYKQIVEQLETFDDEYYLNTPFIVINDQFAVVGYSKGEETELIKEIKRALNNEALGDYYTIGRYQFKH